MSQLKLIRRILSLLKPFVNRIIIASLAMAGVAIVTGASLWLVKEVVDLVLQAKDKEGLVTLVILLITLYSLKALMSYLQAYFMAYVSHGTIRNLRLNVYQNLLTLSLDFFHKNASAKTISRLTNDANLMQGALSRAPVTVVRDGLTILIIIGILFYLNWNLALISFVLLPIAGYIIVQFAKKIRRTSRDSQAKMADLYMVMQETFTAVPVVKSFQRENHEVARFNRENQSYFEMVMKIARADALLSPVMELLGVCALSVILWYGGMDVISGAMTPGALVAFVGGAIQLYQPVKNFSKVNTTIQMGLSAAERIFALQDEKPTVRLSDGAKSLDHFREEVRFEKVNFKYDQGDQVLHDINLSIRHGEAVALVGSSGSGKTTLTHLILRFYDPISGRIVIDGHDIRDLTVESLRKQIAIVTQDILLFNDTVLDNIAYGRPGVSQDKIREAAQMANADQFIKELPNGYETVIGERGVFLSGGQRQRIAIARAFIKDAPILILDEATSALDAQSERLVQGAIENIMVHRTVLIIAHRLATVKRVDRIAVLEGGRIVEMGKHRELLDKRGIYRRFHDLQVLG